MATRRRTLALAIGVVIVAIILLVRRHVRGSMGKRVPGGILVSDVALYDALGHGFLMRPLQRRIARDVAAVAPTDARVLEVGCGPGRLSILLAREHGLGVTGLDLDPAMIERARANAARTDRRPSDRGPSFCVGDVGSMPFPDDSFDVVVSSLSMHHWDDPAAGLVEIARVLRPGGRVLIWDFRPGRIPLHGRLPEPAPHPDVGSLRLVASTRWTWPWPIRLLRRMELEHPVGRGRDGSRPRLHEA
jgi:SAM-dependent methyltransferase